ncbi:MAG: HAD-IIB family hydrolase [Candidatus Paceibacterota bacterium]
MIIACDLDRTLLPNGEEPDDNSLERFYNYLKEHDHTLVYATGRNLRMVQDAYREFNLKVPDYLIASVGTMVYVNDNDELVLDPQWKEHVYRHHPTWNAHSIISELEHVRDVTFQEDEVQNEFKISLYAPVGKEKKEIRQNIVRALVDYEGVEIIYSVDPHKNVGLIDILPTAATKLTALEYIRTSLKKEKDDVLYAGDSGNDILPLTYGYKAVLVKNAREEVKEEVLRITREQGHTERLYVAVGSENEHGNYASGVMEGIKHFSAR